MSDDIFNQISKIIAKKGVSGVSKDAAEWSALLSEMPKAVSETKVESIQNTDSAAAKPVFVQPQVQQNPTPQNPPRQPIAAFEPQQAVQPQSAPFTGAGSIDELRQIVSGCSKCQLANTRTNIVFGEGNHHAELMFIGEAPGADEDLSGRPFVGKAGQLLDKMITAMQFARSEVYIANILKCRPPFNRNPEPGEAACCMPYLEEQIRLVNPKCIVLLGAVATRFLLKHEAAVSKIRGTWQTYKDIPVMVTYHPSYLLRTESAKRDAWNDLQKVMAKFGKYHKKG